MTRPDDFALPGGPGEANIIGVTDGSLVTGWLRQSVGADGGTASTDPMQDILKIALVNRYRDTRPSVGFVKGFGLRKGAIASSVAHDSHNIIAVGAADEDLCDAVNAVIGHRGGLAVSCGRLRDVLPLPIAGLMSPEDGRSVARDYARLRDHARTLGSSLSSAFITLSFMALPVIPHLKMSEKGLFDADAFKPVGVFEKP
jgi:adenine deaminase